MISKNINLVGNPNVGKSTVFNALTGLKQHTGNWSGKTVESASGNFFANGIKYEIFDLPGTYSITSVSPDEKSAEDRICFSNADLTVIVTDATCLERNLNFALRLLEASDNVLLCVNLIDEAKANGISVDIEKLSETMKIPVIGICAKKHKDIQKLKEAIAYASQNPASSAVNVTYPQKIENAINTLCEFTLSLYADISPHLARFIAIKLLDNPLVGKKILFKKIHNPETRVQITSKSEELLSNLKAIGIYPINIRDGIAESCVKLSNYIFDKCVTKSNNKKLCGNTADKILTSKITGIPIMLLFLCGILWLTLCGANYPSQFLSNAFSTLGEHLKLLLSHTSIPDFLCNILVDGIYGTTTWVMAVMLPPMVIFFPLFTVLEDLGFLPRIAFNLDRCFKAANSCGKQALTMCMGLGCNAVGVSGCRIISSESERRAAIITNTFMPCNGRFGMLTILSGIFIGGCFDNKLSSFASAAFVLLLIIIGTLTTLFVTFLLTKFVFKNKKGSFVLELPPYRRPQLIKVLTRSLLDRTIIILGRAISVAAPAGALIWLLASLNINGLSPLYICTDFLDPFARLIGLDGVILFSFILAMPANEIVLPIILMCYMSTNKMIDFSTVTALGELLRNNGWTMLTAINVMLFSLLHFPCATTLKTIKAETKSTKMMILAFIIPTICGICVCFLTTVAYRILF